MVDVEQGVVTFGVRSVLYLLIKLVMAIEPITA